MALLLLGSVAGPGTGILSLPCPPFPVLPCCEAAPLNAAMESVCGGGALYALPAGPGRARSPNASTQFEFKKSLSVVTISQTFITPTPTKPVSKLSKLVTGGIFHRKKMMYAGWMHRPRPRHWVGVQSYAMSFLYVCMSVCLFIRPQTYLKNQMNAACDRCSVLFRRYWDTLRRFLLPVL